MGRPLHESRVLLGHRVHLRDGPVHLLDAAARQQHGTTYALAAAAGIALLGACISFARLHPRTKGR